MVDPHSVVVIGAGGHSSVLIDILLSQSATVVGVSSLAGASDRASFSGFTHFKGEQWRESYGPSDVSLVNGIGYVPFSQKRTEIFDYYSGLGYQFLAVIASSASISTQSRFHEGVQIFHGATVQVGSEINKNAIINTGAIVDHDCVIEAHSHVAPGVTLCGGVRVGEGTFIGAGSTIFPGVNIGARCVVGAGMVVRRDLPRESIVR